MCFGKNLLSLLVISTDSILWSRITLLSHLKCLMTAYINFKEIKIFYITIISIDCIFFSSPLVRFNIFLFLFSLLKCKVELPSCLNFFHLYQDWTRLSLVKWPPGTALQSPGSSWSADSSATGHLVWFLCVCVLWLPPP